MGKELKTAATISKFTKWAVVAIISCGAQVIYLTYLARYSFYDQVIEGLQISNTQLGVLYGLYGTTATIAYFFGGVLADKIRVKYLATLGFALSAVLTFWYSTTPSYEQLKVIFLLFGLCTTLIYWGIRYKAIRLVSSEENYSTNIGISYGVVGAIGLIVSFISIGIFEAFADAQQGFQTVLMFYAGINAVFAVLSFIIIPRFADEFEEKSAKFNLHELVQALKHPGVWLTTLCMFFVYTVYTSLAYTVSFLTDIGAARLWLPPSAPSGPTAPACSPPDHRRSCPEEDSFQDHHLVLPDHRHLPGWPGCSSQERRLHDPRSGPDHRAVLLLKRRIRRNLFHAHRDQGSGCHLRLRLRYPLRNRLPSGYVRFSHRRKVAGYL